MLAAQTSSSSSSTTSRRRRLVIFIKRATHMYSYHQMYSYIQMYLHISSKSTHIIKIYSYQSYSYHQMYLHQMYSAVIVVDDDDERPRNKQKKNRAVSGPVKRPINGSLAGLLAAHTISTLRCLVITVI